jgi:arsenate reductase-like glutaredoxin family protein
VNETQKWATNKKKKVEILNLRTTGLEDQNLKRIFSLAAATIHFWRITPVLTVEEFAHNN